jgi:hypothetical protein
MAALFDPLVVAIGKHVCAGEVLHADDTTVKVLAPGLGRTKTGRLWAAVRDERAFGGAAPPAAFYRYSADRCGEHAQALLASCRGFLHRPQRAQQMRPASRARPPRPDFVSPILP